MQQITPTVSVAVITYNMQQYLPQLLDSILMQKTNFPFEIVVDDDHSPDQSRTILLDYQRRFGLPKRTAALRLKRAPL